MDYLEQIDEICYSMGQIFEVSQDVELPIMTFQETLYFLFDSETENWLLYVTFLDGKVIVASVTKSAINFSHHGEKFEEYRKIANSMQSFLQLQGN